MPNEPNEISITLPFRQYLDEDFLGHLDNRPADLLKAQRIDAINKAYNLQLIHVQYDSLETGKSLDTPLIWRWDKWRVYYKRIEKLKERSAWERSAGGKQRENIEKVKRYFIQKFKLDEKTAMESAIKIAREGLQEFMRDVMGIRISEMTPEERKWAQGITYIDYEKDKRV